MKTIPCYYGIATVFIFFNTQQMESLQQHTKLDPLLSEIATRRDDLILLTQNLIRIPTLNPPGENYRDICEFLNNRLTKHGFNTEMVRA